MVIPIQAQKPSSYRDTVSARSGAKAVQVQLTINYAVPFTVQGTSQ